MSAPNKITCRKLFSLNKICGYPLCIDIPIDSYFATNPHQILRSLSQHHTNFDGLIVHLAT